MKGVMYTPHEGDSISLFDEKLNSPRDGLTSRVEVSELTMNFRKAGSRVLPSTAVRL